ncbi:MAG: DEAD/DEAH box helicase, partial [Spirulina sp. SIO3F2]|nr:DEAD/DEAH box helicase [Spirulina sp. SIO3F2]
MALTSVVRTLTSSPLTQEFASKLRKTQTLQLNGAARLPRGLVASAIAQHLKQNLFVACATLEEAGRWAAQLELMGWSTVSFYPTSEASPYEPLDPESEMVWGQLAVLSQRVSATEDEKPWAIVSTERALQPLLPPPEAFKAAVFTLQAGVSLDSQELDLRLAAMGYERVTLVETEGQWSRRGDIVDVFPVSSELPIRLEWFGDELDKIREFDPATQRSLDTINQLLLTPTGYGAVIAPALKALEASPLTSAEQDALAEGQIPEGLGRYLSLAFGQPASLLGYLPPETVVVLDEPLACAAHCARWVDYVQTQHTAMQPPVPPLHRPFADIEAALAERPYCLHLSELSEEGAGVNLSSRSLPTTPNQFAKLAEILRGKRDVFPGMTLKGYTPWIISAQPSRSAAILQEHDCPVQFVPNVRDYPAIARLQTQKVVVALKYSGLAELESFILPTYKIVVVTDREFFGQHSLASPTYVRKRRRAASKKVDLNKLSPKDYIVHRKHGIGQFLELDSLNQRDYLVIKYADGLLRVPADAADSLSRYQQKGKPELHKMGGKIWERTKARVEKAVKKVAVDLLAIYAQRAERSGFAYPTDTPWQTEMEDSFPYQPTPDQLKATQDIKRDLESDRPMDRLVCGDVGFGKTEVAIRAIFKAVTTANKQVAFLAPTTILTQQHYHTLKERFAPYPVNIGLLNRFRTASERKEIMQRLNTGEIDIVVGTQQILNKSVKFKDLGLLVVDEEQRFGVNQKEKIKALKTQVDVLTLTATPIPRTLYMSLSGIREMSLITTPPPSRRPIETHLSPYNPDVIR